MLQAVSLKALNISGEPRFREKLDEIGAWLQALLGKDNRMHAVQLDTEFGGQWTHLREVKGHLGHPPPCGPTNCSATGA